MIAIRFILSIILLSFFITISMAQRTFLDTSFGPLVRNIRKLTLDFIGRTGNNVESFEINRRMGKLQQQFPSSTPFFCDTKKGPGRRSRTPPKSVHKIRPGDIDIVAAMGDSLTAGNGAMSTNILQVITENKGISWSIGGQENWRKFLTIPNILKEFNPNLYGYSLADGLSTQRISKFNVAELGAMSRDMPYQAKVLIQRLKSDPKVNMTEHWKLVTLFIGANDFCSDMCYYDRPEIVIDRHDQDLMKVLRMLRDNVPKVIVNILVTPSMNILTQMKGTPPECYAGLHFECPCMFGTRAAPMRNRLLNIMEEWKRREIEVGNRDEFHNKEDFTVNVQPFTQNLLFPLGKNGLTDYTYMSTDCFHLSQKGYARATNAIWNNMLEPVGAKTTSWEKEFLKFKCPTKKRRYLATKYNSQ